MRTKWWAILLMVVCTIFVSSAQLFYKAGSEKLVFNIFDILKNGHIIVGIVLYCMGAIIVIAALKGGEVTTLYPIVTSSYIWVGLGSMYFFDESISLFHWMGIFLVIVGIVFIIFGEDKEKIKYAEVI